MRKIVSSAAFLALVLALAWAATAAAPGDRGSAPTLAPEVTPELAPSGNESVLPAVPQACEENASRAVGDGAPLFLAPPPPDFPCPFGAPRCRKHDDCDAYCGDPRFGWCFSDGCCGCSG